MKNLALYIHIPFCNQKKCDYCSFISYCDKKDEFDDYIDHLMKEIKLRGLSEGNQYKISSIYFGGGTPSVLREGDITNIMLQIKRYFKLLPNVEITIEANPDSITEEKLREYLLVGINRISIGVQSINDKLLSSIGRLHNSKQAKQAIKLAQKVGFKNISVDMMIGLPSQTLKDVKKMAKFVAKSHVQHVSCYSLIVEPNTVLQEKLKAGVVTLPSEDETVEMYNLAYEIFKKAGLKRYEVSNFAIEDYECKHNQNYWQLGEYLALGIAGHSYMKDTRFANVEDYNKYITSLDNDTFPIVSVEKLNLNMRREETLMLALRTREGLKIDEYDYKFGGHILKDKKKQVEFLCKNGFISVKNDYLRVCDNAFYVLNRIILMLI